MLIPTKHEKLDNNLLVLGSDILKLLKKKPCNIENLFQELKKVKIFSLNQYYNTITFLWCANLIIVDDYLIRANK